jgi:anhydro-N-acetylmuramic acid kinase
MSKNNYYIGVMSGTSADGVDIALVDFSDGKVQLKAHVYQAYHDQLHQKIRALYSSGHNEIDQMGNLSVELAHYFSHAINQLLTQENLNADDIIAIGCHGQTIRHRPVINHTIQHPFTLQIGCNQTLACLTNIKVIGDFRTKDVALGGQGAPLVPAFHQYLFAAQQQDTFIVNLGGIANITFLPCDKNQPIIGFDTGPANALLDEWCYKHTQQRYDENGQWAAQGNLQPTLLAKLLSDPYFSLPAPKSTGREHFNLNWLAPYLTDFSLDPVDVQATLSALTAHSIAQEINKLSPKSFVYLCGGGIANEHCYKLIKHQLTNHCIKSINSLNLNNNAFEAMAFAWLGFAYEKKIYGNIPTVTGASRKTILGTKFYP